MADELNRPPVTNSIKARIAESFAHVPRGKRGALLVIADESGARFHLAARVGGTWKVAAGAGKPWDARPSGYVGVEAAW